jgi:putative transposase
MVNDPRLRWAPSNGSPRVRLRKTSESICGNRFEIIRPFLEDGVPLTRLAKEQQIVLRTARRWVERYRKSGLAGLVRKERNDKDERRLLPELQEIMEAFMQC